MDKTHKLSPKQMALLSGANIRVDRAKALYEAELRQLEAVSELIMDFHGISSDAKIRVNPETQELIEESPTPTTQH